MGKIATCVTLLGKQGLAMDRHVTTVAGLRKFQSMGNIIGRHELGDSTGPTVTKVTRTANNDITVLTKHDRGLLSGPVIHPIRSRIAAYLLRVVIANV